MSSWVKAFVGTVVCGIFAGIGLVVGFVVHMLVFGYRLGRWSGSQAIEYTYGLREYRRDV